MGCCGFVMKLGFLAFFVVNGWNTFQNIEGHVSTFKTDYKNFEHSIITRTGVSLPPLLQHAHIWKHGETIVKVLAWSQIILSAASILIWGGFTSLVGIVYFLQQAIHLNIAGLSTQANFAELEKLAMPLSLLMASFAVGCCATSSSKKCAYNLTRRSQATTDHRASQATDKKRQ